MNDLELPLGKRSRTYRILEMLPGIVSYSMIGAVVILSLISPILASVYILLFVITIGVRSLGIAAHSVVGYFKLNSAQKIDWRKRLEDLENPEQEFKKLGKSSRKLSENVHHENLRLISADTRGYPKPSQLHNVVILTAYNEPYDVIQPTMQTLVETTYNKDQMTIVFAYEKRGGYEMRVTAERLQEEYSQYFGHYMIVEHPDDLADEIIGKGPNLTYAARKLEKYIKKQKIDFSDVIVTTLDCDNKPYKTYFDYVTYEYIIHSNRKRLSFQPISLYFSNIWDAPAPMRVLAIGNSFWTVVSSVRPHLLRNFASHSQPLDALSEMDYWSKRSIVEDGHQYWRSYFYFGGDYDVVPIYVPVYQDAVLAGSFKRTVIAQFKQLRRWAYGASDIPYVATRVFSRHRNVPFFPSLARLFRLIDGHVSLAIVAIIVAIGGWIPLLINNASQTNIIANNLPYVIGQVQFYAMIGLFITIILTIRLIPPRPARYRRTKHLFMLLQWLLMPITAIFFSALASIVAQTHLLFGRYLDKFDVTEKVNRN